MGYYRWHFEDFSKRGQKQKKGKINISFEYDSVFLWRWIQDLKKYDFWKGLFKQFKKQI